MSNETDTRTITVAGTFREIQITKEDFIKQWVDHVGQCKNITWNADFIGVVNDFQDYIRDQAGLEFERIYSKAQ